MFSFASRLMSSVWDDCMLLTVSCVLTCTGMLNSVYVNCHVLFPLLLFECVKW